MKRGYIIWGIIILAALLCLIAYLNKQQKNQEAEVKQPVNTNKPKPVTSYLGLRQQMLTITPEALQINLPKDKETAFGAVLEISSNDRTATIVSFITGDASLYTSVGGGVIGGIAHQNVKDAAVAFVTAAQNYIATMPVNTNLDPPKAGDIKLYILTNKKQYAVETTINDIAKPENPYNALFNKANDVISQLRQVSNKK